MNYNEIILKHITHVGKVNTNFLRFNISQMFRLNVLEASSQSYILTKLYQSQFFFNLTDGDVCGDVSDDSYDSDRVFFSNPF